MLKFYRLEDENEKSEAYNDLWELVLKGFPVATLQEQPEGFCILWCGVAIGEMGKTA